MKQTIFHHGFGKDEIKFKVDFIYKPPITKESVAVLIDEKEYHVVQIIDEFTKNPDAQIRHIRIMENLLPKVKHFF